MERKKLREQLQWLKSDGSGVSHGPAVLAVLCLAAAAGLAAMVFVYGMDQLFGYGAGLFLALAVAAFAKQKSLAGKGPRRIEELEKSLAAVQERMEALAAEAKAGLAASDDDDVWSRKLDEIRMQYMDWKTQESKTVWEKEQKVMYDAIYDEWNKKGAAWQGKLEASRKAWESWRSGSGFASLEVGQLAQAKEVWDKWHAAVSASESWRVRKEDLLRRMGQWRDSAEQLFRELGVAGEGTPEQTEAVYKQWQTIRVQAEVAREQDKQQQERQAQIVQLQKDKEIRQNQQQDLLALTGAQTTGEFRSKVLKFRAVRSPYPAHRQDAEAVGGAAARAESPYAEKLDGRTGILRKENRRRGKEISRSRRKTGQHHRTAQPDGQKRRLRPTSAGKTKPQGRAGRQGERVADLSLRPVYARRGPVVLRTGAPTLSYPPGRRLPPPHDPGPLHPPGQL